MVLLMVGRQRLQQLALPAGGYRRIEQVITGTNKTGIFQQQIQAAGAELTPSRRR